MQKTVDELLDAYGVVDDELASPTGSPTIRYDRGELLAACASTRTGAAMASATNLPKLLRFLLVGSGSINAPYSFADAPELEEPEAAREAVAQAAVALAVLRRDCSAISSPGSPVDAAAAAAPGHPVDEAEIRGLLRYFAARCAPEALARAGRLLAPLALAMARSGQWDFGLLLALLQRVLAHWAPWPRFAAEFTAPFAELFRLLLQYYDPQLSLHLDHQHTSIGEWAVAWLLGMFTPDTGADAAVGESAAAPRGGSRGSRAPSSDALELWLWLFASDRRELAVYSLLALLVDHRSLLLKITGRDALRAVLADFRFVTTTPNSGPKDVLLAAKMLHSKTPTSARAAVLWCVFGDAPPPPPPPPPPPVSGDNNRSTREGSPLLASNAEGVGGDAANGAASSLSAEQLRERYLSAVALPIEAQELVDTFALHEAGAPRRAFIRYIVLDCRAESSFAFAHLPTAMHVGDAIGFDPALMAEMLARFKTVKGSHLTIMGTGKSLVEEANLLKIIALQFIQAGFPHLSVVESGFRGCIPFIKSGKIEYVRGAAAAPQRPRRAAERSAESGAQGREVGDHESSSSSSSNAAKERLREAAEQTKDRLSVAKQWGLGFVRSIASKTQEAVHHLQHQHQHQHPSGAATDQQGGPPKGSRAGGESNGLAAGAAGGENTGEQRRKETPRRGSSPRTDVSTAAGAAALEGQRTPEPPTGDAAFSMGAEDDDDDLGLITSVTPPHPSTPPPLAPAAATKVEGKEEDEEAAAAPGECEEPDAGRDDGLQKDAGEVPNSPSGSPKPAEGQGEKHDEEPDDFFETPVRSTAPAAGAASAAKLLSGSTSAAKHHDPHPFDDIFDE